jgi:hypothetical protein
MLHSIESIRQQYKGRAERFDRRAEESGTSALREYYRGRAEEARAIASELQKHTVDPEALERGAAALAD